MRVAEKFISINGEGPKAGELSVFLRFAGCNLRCSYCDTLWANAPDCPVTEETPEQLAEYVISTGVANVTVTGGEPLLQDREELFALFGRLAAAQPGGREQGRGSGRERLAVEIETNGAVDLAPFCGKEAGSSSGTDCRPAFTMDYKLPSSGCEHRMCLSNFALLERQDTVKFVCGGPEDLRRAGQVIAEYGLTEKCHVYLSPVFGVIDPKDMVEYMERHHMNGVRLQLQLHKYIWEPDRRGV